MPSRPGGWWLHVLGRQGSGGGHTHLVSLMGGRGGNLALLARGELGQVAVIITLPVMEISLDAIRMK